MIGFMARCFRSPLARFSSFPKAGGATGTERASPDTVRSDKLPGTGIQLQQRRS